MTHTDVGDNPKPSISSRRSLLGAGAVGAVAALLAARSAAAAPPASTAPVRPTEGDVTLLNFAMLLELTAHDLYAAAVDAGADPSLLQVIGQNHAAYAESIAGLAGFSASGRIDSLYDEAESSFATDDTAAVLAAAYDLEATAVATHTELLGELEYIGAATLVASVLAIEARHSTVLADAAGNDRDLDALLTTDASPISPEEQQ